MSNSLTKRGPSCSCRIAFAARVAKPSSRKASLLSVTPSRKPITSRPRSGRLADTRGPPPPPAAPRAVAGAAPREADHQQAEVGTAREHRGAHARLSRRAGVRGLGLTVDVEVLGVVLAHADDVDAVGGGPLDVAVGQPAGEVLELAWPLRQDRDLREALVQLALGQGEDR